LGDQAQDALAPVLVEHVDCRNARDANAAAGEPGVAARIACGVLAHVVGAAIDLDREAGRGKVEIEHAAVHRVLLAEAQPVERLTPQRLPEEHFGERHFATEAAGAGEGFVRRSHPVALFC